MSTIKMVCPRDYTLRTKLGHTIRFEADVPTDVPEAAYHEALAKNILPVKVQAGEKPAFELATAEITGTLRDALIFDAIIALVKRNNSEDFTGGGVPKAASITAEIGVAVSAQETSKYWGLYKQIIGENSSFPTHPNVELVRELQGCATRKQLEQFAGDLSIELPSLKGKSLTEIKSILLYNIINQHQAPLTVDADEYVKPESLTMD